MNRKKNGPKTSFEPTVFDIKMFEIEPPENNRRFPFINDVVDNTYQQALRFGHVLETLPKM